MWEDNEEKEFHQINLLGKDAIGEVIRTAIGVLLADRRKKLQTPYQKKESGFQTIIQAMARTHMSSMKGLPKIQYAKRSMDNPTYGLLEWLLKPFVTISDGNSSELIRSSDEEGQYIQFLLYLVDMNSC